MSVREVAFVALGILIGCTDDRALGVVRINEVSPDNVAGCTDVFGEYDDWIELYNSSLATVDLGGYHVTDSTTALDAATIPAAVTIPPGGYLLLWADAQDKQGLDHLPFKLNAGGDSVTLTAPDGTVLDALRWKSSDPDVSFARVPNGAGDFTACALPTCGRSNSNAR